MVALLSLSVSTVCTVLARLLVCVSIYVPLELVRHWVNALLSESLLQQGSPPLLAVRPAAVAGAHPRWGTRVIREAGAADSRRTAAVHQASSLGGVFETHPFEIPRSRAVCDSCCLLALGVLGIPCPGALESPPLALGRG